MNAEYAIVLGNNSRMLQAGQALYEAPSTVFPCVVGMPRQTHITLGNHKTRYPNNTVWTGADCLTNQSLLDYIYYPVENGIVKHWEYMETIWRHALYSELRMDPEEQPVLLAESPLNPKRNREMTTEIMFETFRVPAFHLANQDVLSLYSTGRTTGIVCDSGTTSSRVTPIIDGYPILQAVCTTNIGGDDVANYLIKQQNISCMLSSEIVTDIKAELCYIKCDDKED
jgi:actin beta/gamma 1